MRRKAWESPSASWSPQAEIVQRGRRPVVDLAAPPLLIPDNPNGSSFNEWELE
ncbi:hypothetical protein GCM10009803_23080 [Microbacterium ginsengiterrae]